MTSTFLLQKIRQQESLSAKEQRRLILSLSWPAILAQISVTIMQLIDASMVGQLGTQASAAIGLVASTTWLINGISSGTVYGFSVQTAQAIGAKDIEQAGNLCLQGLVVVLSVGVLLGGIGALLSSWIPLWLGAEAHLIISATLYLRIFCLALPFGLLNSWTVQMLQAAGDTKIPGFCQIVMCLLDVVFNGLFIYGWHLGVMGAALGTALATACSALFLSYWTLFKNPFLCQPKHLHFTKNSLQRAFRIGLPISLEQLITGSSYVTFTRIVSSLGTISIAANSFAITAESLCYMPAFGCASAATAILGQCTGAKRPQLAKEISWRLVRIGILMMSFSGLLLFLLAHSLMALLTPDLAVQELGTQILRLEAFAEPMYGAAIVANGILRGKGDTIWPACLNFLSIWGIRIPLAAFLAKQVGLFGAWIAMGVELDARGLLFLWRLKQAWKKRPLKKHAS